MSDREEIVDSVDPASPSGAAIDPADAASAAELPNGEDRDAEDPIAEEADAPEPNAQEPDTEEPDTEEPDTEEPVEDLDDLSDVPEDDAEISDSELFKVRASRRKVGSTTAAPAPRGRRRAAPGARPAEDHSGTNSIPAGAGAGAGSGARARKTRDESDEDSDIERPNETEEQRHRRELDARLDAALSRNGGVKRKKMTGDDIEMMQDGAVARLRDAMRQAALRDAESVEKGEPALAKVKMLPRVVNVLGKQTLADSILDGNLLESVRLWLEPLPDASLPTYEIQKELFKALETLPIKTLHLRESGLGRVVLFYQKSKRPHLAIKRTADRLIGNWTRPIMGRSDNYRDKRVKTVAYDAEEAAFSESNARREGRSAGEEAALRRGRAAMPTARGETYSVAPVSAVAMPLESKSAPPDNPLRRMKTRLSLANKRGKKSGVSIEGRGLH